MNKEYIINKVRPFLNNKGMLTEENFNKLFSKLTLRQQYEVINILIEENIEIDYESEGEIDQKNVEVYKGNLYAKKIKNLTNEQLCAIYQQGNRLALEALIIRNANLVRSRAFKYFKKYNHRLDEEDLVQCGFMGLMKAAERFDFKKEVKFVTYATWWIDQYILRNIIEYGFIIRIPVHYFEKVNKIMGILYLYPDYSKDQILELVKKDGIDKDKFEEIIFIVENILSTASLNSFVGEEKDTELGELIIDENNLSVEEEVENKILKETIDCVLDTLTEREKDILGLRFGLKDGIERTLEQIGLKYGLTRERIRQLEAKAIKKLGKPEISAKLKDFLWG
ncbi:sigma-70 family RNA polymerase sigma factor [Caldanaerobius polysaccharolyticus]|uniref:sigma-70 family RNA polymerase sigma factor n=1 Tax=Caldanaerobius polysaccharolyticus TaxID=44256 RepID=UPI00068B9F8B|nr:sigma-70 family RNA polymerase sigma factor [Caldanaerobius polysaccharolyticus]